MYRDNDIDKLKLNIDNIVNESLLIYKTNYEPTLDESKQIYDIILNYIKINKKIIYGGYAQNNLITLKNKYDGFYNDLSLPDIEFYSNDPLTDLIDLCDILHNKKFKYVQGQEGIHCGTYKIFVNFINYCDITYISKNIYDNIKYIENNDKIHLAHPYFMYVDTFRVFTDSMTSYWRLEKTFSRFIKLFSYYPIITKIPSIKFTTLSLPKNLRIIRKKIIQNSKYIIIGTYAYNYYISKIDKNNIIKVNFYEIITNNFNIEVNKIYKKLKKIFKDKLSTKEYYPYYEFFDYRIDFLYDNKILLRVYNNNNKCIVYNLSEKKKNILEQYN